MTNFYGIHVTSIGNMWPLLESCHYSIGTKKCISSLLKVILNKTNSNIFPSFIHSLITIRKEKKVDIEAQLLLLQTTLSVQATETDPMLHSHPVVQAVQFSIKEANIIVTNMLKQWNRDPSFDVFDRINIQNQNILKENINVSLIDY